MTNDYLMIYYIKIWWLNDTRNQFFPDYRSMYNHEIQSHSMSKYMLHYLFFFLHVLHAEHNSQVMVVHFA